MTRNRLVIIMAVTVVLLAAACIGLLISGDSTGDGAGDGGGLTLRSTDIADIRTIAIRNQYGEFTVTALDGGFVVHDIPSPLVDYDRFARMMTSCTQVRASGRVDASSGNLSIYGLESAAASVVITVTDGDYGFDIGAAEPVSGEYYFRISGESGVFLTPAIYAEDLFLPVSDYIDRIATPPLYLSSPLSAIQDVTFAGERYDEPLVLRSVTSGDDDTKRLSLSYGAATHLVFHSGNAFKLDQTYGIETLGSLLGIQADGVAAYNLSPVAMAGYGFDTPYLTVTFGLVSAPGEPPEIYELKIVADGENLFLAVNDRGVVYRIPDLAFINIDAAKLISRWYLSPMLSDVCRLEVNAPDLPAMVFEISGDTNDDRRVLLNGEAMDLALYRAFFNFLVSASHDGELLAEDDGSAEDPIFAATYYYNDPLKQPDEIVFYRGEARKAVPRINGVPSRYGMREMFVTRAKDACRAVLAGETFETMW